MEFESSIEEYKLRRDVGQASHPRQQEVREPVHRCAVRFSEDTDVLMNVDAQAAAQSLPHFHLNLQEELQ